MKYKYILFALGLATITSAHALNWQKANVLRTIDTEHALLSNGKVIKLIGFDGPNHLIPTLKERGTARKTYRLLKLIFNSQKIKILKDKTDCENNIYPRHVKLENGEYLTELLLQKGLGIFKSDTVNTRFDKKFQKAEAFAQQNKIGRWGKPMYQEMRQQITKTAGVMTRIWRKKYAHLLGPISTGRVRSVKTGNTFLLENGACIKLLGIETPSPRDKRRGYKCFGEQSRDYLASLILGKKVEFTKDVSQLDDKYCIQRHVWIPGNQKDFRSRQHINKEMITNGYGKFSPLPINKKFKNEFSVLQNNVYSNPNGAWMNCAVEILNGEKKSAPSIDTSCPIKISKSGKAHDPKSSWYKRMTPVKCFQTKDEAFKAGFEIVN